LQLAESRGDLLQIGNDGTQARWLAIELAGGLLGPKPAGRKTDCS
jgi:hypothetical protein